MTEEIEVFISLLSDKNLIITGHEKLFAELLINKLSEKNYNEKLTKFGDFLNGKNKISFEKAIYEYINVVGIHEAKNISNLDFANRYFCIKKIIHKRKSLAQLERSVEINIDKFILNKKKENLTGRLGGANNFSARISITDVDNFWVLNSKIFFPNYLKNLLTK